MKKVFVIILAVLIAATGGLLVYGATRKAPEISETISKGLLAAPPANVSNGAAHWYDVETMLAAPSAKQKAANLLVYTAYNHINVKEFFFKAHVDVLSGNKYSCSDYYRTEQGANAFYEAFAYTGGSANSATRRIDYNNQRLTDYSISVTYDRSEKIYSTAWNDPKVENRESDLPAETPYIIYSWYDLPIDLGGRQDAYNEIKTSLISDQVSIDYPSDGKPYYSVEFVADIEKANASEETVRRLAEGTGDVMKKIDILELSFEAEIWPCGLFRSLKVNVRVVASVQGKRGQGTITRTYEFSYDKVDCSVANKFKQTGLDKYLSEENKAICESEFAALPKEEEPQA